MSRIRETIIYNLVILTLGILGLYLFKMSKQNNKFKFKHNRYPNLKSIFVNDKESTIINSVFEKAEIKLTFTQYQVIRYLLFIVFLLLVIATYFYSGQGKMPYNQLIAVLILFLISSPKTKVTGKSTPFLLCVEYKANKVRNEKNTEIYRAISQLKNLSMIYQENPPEGLFILEQLRKFTVKIRPAFNTLMRDWERGERDKACSKFQAEIGTPQAEKFTDILIKLDDLSPSELKKQLELFQESVRKDRETEKLKSNENISSIVYFFVMAAAFIVLMNFIIVTFYCDYLHLMQYI